MKLQAGEGRKQILNRSMRWSLRAAIVLSIVAFVFYWIGKSFVPTGVDYSKSYEEQGREHIAVGTSHPPYNSNPPSSGWHYVESALEGFYDINEPLPDEQLIHNLEHGHILIAYHPRISKEVREKLKSFDGSHMVIAPREANETDIALVAWGRVDAFNLERSTLDEDRIANFIKRYINTGPEKIMTSRHR